MQAKKIQKDLNFRKLKEAAGSRRKLQEASGSYRNLQKPENFNLSGNGQTDGQTYISTSRAAPSQLKIGLRNHIKSQHLNVGVK